MSLMLLSSGKKKKTKKDLFPIKWSQKSKPMLELSQTLQNLSEFLSASLERSRIPRQSLMLTLCNSSRNQKQEITRVSSSKADFKVHF